MSIRKMIGRHPQVQGSVNEALALAVRHMMFCSDICTSCADACIAEDKVADLRQCIRVCLDCADVCDMAFKVGTRRTGSNEMLRSEEGRVGKEGVSTCRSRGAPTH